MMDTAAARIATAHGAFHGHTITDLGTFPGGTNSFAYGINAAGWVVGTADVATGASHAFLYANGQLQDLGTLGGRNSVAIGVDAFGRVVGYSEIATGAVHAFSWLTYGSLLDLETLGGQNSFAAAIVFVQGMGELRGLVVGASDTADGSRRAFLYSGGPLRDLGALPGGTSSSAAGVAVGGMVVGDATVSSGVPHAFLYSNGSLQDLGTLGGGKSVAAAVNAAGRVVGTAQLSRGANHAFLYSGGVMQDLGTLGGTNSSALAVNGAGLVVGVSENAGGQSHAFLYDGAMANLNSLLPANSGWELNVATAINDAGQIAGFGVHNGRARAFLMTPI